MGSTLAYLPVVTALRALLVADGTLVGLLAAIPAAYGTGPGIYSDGAVPEQAGFPVLVIGGGSETGNNTMGSGDAALKFGSRVSLQIKAMSLQRNDDQVAGIINRVKAVLYEGRALTVSGYGSACVEQVSATSIYAENVAGALIRHFPLLVYVEVHQT